mmetsp:Transcript_23420/g.42726  ORF Transcript_23420/g.42726 Transcript_23420/m.42726 type:complete len:214 (-) Transcript_23420:361-1002(-)
MGLKEDQGSHIMDCQKHQNCRGKESKHLGFKQPSMKSDGSQGRPRVTIHGLPKASKSCHFLCHSLFRFLGRFHRIGKIGLCTCQTILCTLVSFLRRCKLGIVFLFACFFLQVSNEGSKVLELLLFGGHTGRNLHKHWPFFFSLPGKLREFFNCCLECHFVTPPQWVIVSKDPGGTICIHPLQQGQLLRRLFRNCLEPFSGKLLIFPETLKKRF